MIPIRLVKLMFILCALGGWPTTSLGSYLIPGYGYSHEEYPRETKAKYFDFLNDLHFHWSQKSFFETQLSSLEKSQSEQGSPTLATLKRCKSFYSNLYSKPFITVRTVYGYFESLNSKKRTISVLDQDEVQLLRHHLTSKCPTPDSFACEFQESSLLGDRLVKSIKGPDGEKHFLLMEFVHSSHSVVDRENRSRNNYNVPSTMQLAQTKTAEKAFYDGFNEADVLVYMGHSRDGGGPSFAPPFLSQIGSRAGHVNYNYYKREKPGFKRLVDALEKATHPPKILNLWSCKSFSLFATNEGTTLGRKMKALLRDKNVLFIGATGLTDSSSDLGNFIGMIDSLLGQRCGDGFTASVSIHGSISKTKILGPTP